MDTGVALRLVNFKVSANGEVLGLKTPIANNAHEPVLASKNNGPSPTIFLHRNSPSEDFVTTDPHTKVGLKLAADQIVAGHPALMKRAIVFDTVGGAATSGVKQVVFVPLRSEFDDTFYDSEKCGSLILSGDYHTPFGCRWSRFEVDSRGALETQVSAGGRPSLVGPLYLAYLTAAHVLDHGAEKAVSYLASLRFRLRKRPLSVYETRILSWIVDLQRKLKLEKRPSKDHVLLAVEFWALFLFSENVSVWGVDKVLPERWRTPDEQDSSDDEELSHPDGPDSPTAWLGRDFLNSPEVGDGPDAAVSPGMMAKNIDDWKQYATEDFREEFCRRFLLRVAQAAQSHVASFGDDSRRLEEALLPPAEEARYVLSQAFEAEALGKEGIELALKVVHILYSEERASMAQFVVDGLGQWEIGQWKQVDPWQPASQPWHPVDNPSCHFVPLGTIGESEVAPLMLAAGRLGTQVQKGEEQAAAAKTEADKMRAPGKAFGVGIGRVANGYFYIFFLQNRITSTIASQNELLSLCD